MKLIGIDLDGTLLKDDKTISLNSENIFNKINKERNEIVLISGRTYAGIINYYNQLNLNGPIVSLNGALITYPDNTYVATYLDSKTINEFFLEKKDIIKSLMLTTKDTTYSYKYSLETEEIFLGASNIYQKEFSLDNNNDKFLGGVLVVSDNDRLSLENYFSNKVLNVRYWGSHNKLAFYDIHNRNISKATALEYLKNTNNKYNSLITFGDGPNDIEMIKLADKSIAMLNGDDNIKENATDISEFTNNNDGVAMYIKRHLELF